LQLAQGALFSLEDLVSEMSGCRRAAAETKYIQFQIG